LDLDFILIAWRIGLEFIWNFEIGLGIEMKIYGIGLEFEIGMKLIFNLDLDWKLYF